MLKRVIPVCLICVLAWLSHPPSAKAKAPTAVADQVLSVWPADPPTWKVPADAEQDVSTPESGGVAGKPVVRLKYVTKPELHVYRAKGTDTGTTVLINPGGAYQILAWDLEGTEIAQWLAGLGVNAIVVKYRVPNDKKIDNHWQPAVQDIQRAVSMVRSGAIEGVTAKQVGVLGFSAGGNASARVATAPRRYYEPIDNVETQSAKPDFAVLIYPAWLNTKGLPHVLSDEFKIDKDTPPMFLAASQDDKNHVMSSVTMFRALTDNRVTSSLHVFDNGGHGFGGRVSGTSSDAWRGLCETWLRNQGWLAAKP